MKNKKSIWLKHAVSLDGKVYERIPELVNQYTSQTFEDHYTYYGADLGAVYTPEKTTIKLWSPAADNVWVNLYGTGSDSEIGSWKRGMNRMRLSKENPGVWEICFNENLKNVYYTFTLSFQGKMVESGDPYAKAAGINGLRSMIVDLKATDPKGWTNDFYRYTGTQTEAVLWETHVNDYSHASSSGMKYKGGYLALGESGCRVVVEENGYRQVYSTVTTGIDHLKELGITHVHLLPLHENATVDERRRGASYNWGYDPLNYNVPEGSFSEDPYHGEVRIRELKQAIYAMHSQGIGVVLDVVYNHTYHTDDSWFERIMPVYYHRTMPDGGFGNASGCGNETASERSMMRLYMLDSIRYWAEEYHLDGFRFDLMGIHDTDTMNEIRDLLNALGKKNGKFYLLYGEPWAALPPALPEGILPSDGGHLELLKENIGVFGDGIRDAVKGSCFDKEMPGFVSGAEDKEEAIAKGVCAYCSQDNTLLPSRMVSYVSSHDNFSLWDKLTYTVETDGSGYNEPEMIRVAVNKLAAAIYLTSQGMVFMQSGEEFGRSKQGDGNSYKSGPHINDLDWKRKIKFRELFEYYKGLIAIRKKYDVFTDASGDSARSMDVFIKEDHVVGYRIPGRKKGDPKNILVLFNGSEENRGVTLPEEVGEDTLWTVLANESVASVYGVSHFAGRKAYLYMRSALIAVSEENL